MGARELKCIICDKKRKLEEILAEVWVCLQCIKLHKALKKDIEVVAKRHKAYRNGRKK